MNDNINPKQKVAPELRSQLEKAADFHGHLGPFLVIGVRMGLIGLRKIGKYEIGQLKVEVSLPIHVPFSCIIDGIQIITHCTIGNQKLSLKDSDSVKAIFKIESKKMEMIVTISKSLLKELKSQLLGKDILGEKIHKLAWKVAGLSEDILFNVS
ncbi:MAG: formylmethanofuran dehydrogenase subunit E family protein [Candidatus Bathyarchaeota archaeon]|jgi:formylmethanofuran dehydrogenase subunit E